MGGGMTRPTHNPSTQKRMKARPTKFPQPKILKLSRQHSLDVLGINSEKKIGTYLTDAKRRHTSSLPPRDPLEAVLEYLRNELFLIRLQNLPQIANAK